MILDSNQAFEVFQFWWFALAGARPDKPAPRLETEERLRHKLVRVSMADGGGGRVLREPCELELTREERLALVERIAEYPWAPAARPTAGAAAAVLGGRLAGDPRTPSPQLVTRAGQR